MLDFPSLLHVSIQMSQISQNFYVIQKMYLKKELAPGVKRLNVSYERFLAIKRSLKSLSARRFKREQ